MTRGQSLCNGTLPTAEARYCTSSARSRMLHACYCTDHRRDLVPLSGRALRACPRCSSGRSQISHTPQLLLRTRNTFPTQSLWRPRHNLPPLLENPPPHRTHSLLSPMPNPIPVRILHLPHIALQLRIPAILGRLPEAGADFAVRGRGLGCLRRDDVGED